MKSVTPFNDPLAQEALEARYALRVAARLTERAESVGPDIAERLRVAREQALERAAAARRAVAPLATASAGASVVSVSGDGSAALAGGHPGWWVRLGSIVPLLALVAGLMLIGYLRDARQIDAAAEIDAALLADDLPPDAYRDAGFVEFLKAPQD